MTQITLLRAFAKVWIGFSVALVSVGALGILLQHGWGRLAEVFSPFNFVNFAAIAILVSPAFFAHRRATRLDQSRPLSRAEAEKIVNDYGAVLMRKTGFAERLPLSALPQSKPRVKAAIKLAAALLGPGAARENLGAGYVLLADFQDSGVSHHQALEEMTELTDDWSRFIREPG